MFLDQPDTEKWYRRFVMYIDATSLGGRKVWKKNGFVNPRLKGPKYAYSYRFLSLPCSFPNKRHPGLVSAAGPLLTLPQSCKGPCSRLGHAPCYRYGCIKFLFQTVSISMFKKNVCVCIYIHVYIYIYVNRKKKRKANVSLRVFQAISTSWSIYSIRFVRSLPQYKHHWARPGKTSDGGFWKQRSC